MCGDRWAEALVCAIAVVALTACSSPQPKETPTKLSATAIVDPATGTIRLPLADYGSTPIEAGLLSTANNLAMSRCMKRAGFGNFLPFVGSQTAKPESSRRFGVWVRAEMARLGYQKPPDTPLQKRLQLMNRQEMTRPANKAFEGCLVTTQRLGLRVRELPDDIPSQPALQDPHPEDSKEWKAARQEWGSCLTEHEVPKPPGQEWIPVGLLQAPLEVQIRVGLIDVACKEKVHLVQRLSNLEAQGEQPSIDTHEAALGVTAPGPGVRVRVADVPVEVIAIVGSTERVPGLDRAVLVPAALARSVGGEQAEESRVVRTEPGRAFAVSEVLTKVLRPDRPGAVEVEPVPDLRLLRRRVSTDLDSSAAILSAVMLALAAITSTNVMTMTVNTRRPEIALRRAVGMSRWTVGLTFLGEGAVVGAFGGIVGSAAGWPRRWSLPTPRIGSPSCPSGWGQPVWAAGWPSA